MKIKAHWLVLIPLLSSGIMILQGILLKWQPVDDAYISFRYAKNFAQGNGLVFNIGQRVEGYTNFLWTFILGFASKSGFDIVNASQCLGVAFAVLTLVLTYILALNVAKERGWPSYAAAIPPAILALYPGMAYWALSGMEVMLLSALVTGFYLMAFTDRHTPLTMIITGVLGALAAMTRLEIVLLWPVVVAAQMLRNDVAPRKKIAAMLGIGATMVIIFGCYFLWRFSYYGELMPNTYYAKVGGSLVDRLRGGFMYSIEFMLCWLMPIALLLWIAAPMKRWSMAIFTSIVIYVLYATWTGGDHFPWLRFYFPIIPLVAVFVTEMVVKLADQFNFKNQYIVGVYKFAISAALVVTIAGIALRVDILSAQGHRLLVGKWQRIGIWASRSLPQNSSIVLAPIGVISYYCNNNIVDILGLTDKEIAHKGEFNPHEPPGHQRDGSAIVFQRKPDIILGQATVFAYPPTEQQAFASSARKALLNLYGSEKFAQMYKYEVAHIDDYYVPYWQRVEN